MKSVARGPPQRTDTYSPEQITYINDKGTASDTKDCVFFYS